MEIDYFKIKSGDSEYIRSLIETEKQEKWNELLKGKFKECPPDMLDSMKTIWEYGFTNGAEFSLKIMNDVLVSKINELTPPS